MRRALLPVLLLSACLLDAQSRRILYVTHSAGYRHESIEASTQVLRALSPQLEVTATEDLSTITEQNLRSYHAVLFFTSGELALSADQKSALLDFVRRGGGFGGVHSATDTLYTWPEYGELIGGYFDGHPWVQPVRIDVEDPEHPAAAHLKPSFTIMDEIYQFRNFSRNRVRVLMTLDTDSVDRNAQGAHRHTADFPISWVRQYGSGRVFYTALGHFEGTWRDVRFQQALAGALEWLTGRTNASATPRTSTQSAQVALVVNAFRADPADRIAPRSWISIYGSNLTSGSTMQSGGGRSLAGTSATVAGLPIRLVFASPTQLNGLMPDGLPEGDTNLEVSSRDSPQPAVRPVAIVTSAPGCVA
ncbi:MAG TPA: ThuA domain-containing protein, partial [Bryobacteraceae bacterium]|nr:ThuA domain-containing protein [Bryobacteraceae bacterium]